MTALRITLVDAEGALRGSQALDESEVILGRELIADLGGGADPSVSRRHGRLVRTDTKFLVEDLGSRNGTFVNGQRIDGPWPITAGDIIELAGHRFHVIDGDNANEPARSLYARATLAATRARAPERLGLVYALTQLISAGADAERVTKELRSVVERALSPARLDVLSALDSFDATEPFAKLDLVEQVLGRAEVLRRSQDGGTTAVALPLGLDAAHGLVVAVAERPWSDDDVAFLLAVSTLAASAIHRGERDAAMTLAPMDELIGESETMLAAKASVDRVAAHADLSVLLVGETGTGKELFARRLHRLSQRSGPFVPVNLAAVPADLAESELFGHEKGAFTGATEARRGYVELADGGTLFLDEIGEMPAALQAKLLRVLQERTITRLGSPHPIAVDIRLVAATNADLEAKIASGTFREDLYYRIADQQTTLPPLRERTGDIELLARAFLAANRGRTTPVVTDIDHDALALLERYTWPGNVRQLEGTIRLATIHAAADGLATIALDHIDDRIRAAHPPPPARQPLARELEANERAIVIRALEKTGGNKRGAARELGISINTLRSRLKRYEITEDEYRG